MMDDSLNERIFDKLRTYSTAAPHLINSSELLRTMIARLHSRTTSQDKQVRDKTLFQLRKKKDNNLQTLLILVEKIHDQTTIAGIVGIIRECISPKAGIARFCVLRQLVDLKASQIFIKLLVQLSSREVLMSDAVLNELIWALGQLSQKDAKFAAKVRHFNALPAFHAYLKIFYQHDCKLILPLLMIIKTMAKNNNLQSALIKDGISSTMEKIFFSANSNPSCKLKLVLNIFSYLSKNAHFCSRIIKAGIVPVLLKIFSRWDKYEGKSRYKICNDTIATLQHICVSKQGRSVIRRENGFTPLYKFCLSCPDDKVYDRLLTKVCTVINVCLQKKELPLSSVASPAHFPLPVEFKKDSYSNNIDSDDSDEESGLEDDFDSSANDPDDDYEIRRKTSNDANGSIAIVSTKTLYRNISDLQMYRNMFAEYYILFYQGKYDVDITVTKSRSECGENELEKSNASVACDIPVLNEIDDNTMSARSIYFKIASATRNVLPFVKVAYPDLTGGDGIGSLQPLYVKDRKVSRGNQVLYASIESFNIHNQSRYWKRAFQKRSKLITGVDRCISDDKIYNNVVYDMDKLLYTQIYDTSSNRRLTNNDETRIGTKECVTSTLNFESRFESGNLRKAIQTGPREYDLILTPDVNSSHHCQWFYFEVSNMDNMAPYTFNIINCEKTNSQFNYGMKPLLYSVREATLGRPGWIRSGNDICYYRNGFKVPHNNTHTFLTASFSIKFPHSLDVCYVAYTFPYTYSQLLNRIKNWTRAIDTKNVYLKIDNLCNSLNGNPVPLITVTAPDTKENRVVDREIVFLTSRVHPGEANSSWVIDGCITYLLDTNANAAKLRNQYVFKIVPMLNVEGVINGCHRCGLTDEDLNRKWSHPDRQLHPSIYHTKGLLEYCTRVLRKTPFIFCDFHGHSRRKNAFFFGCSNHESWLEADRNLPNVGIEHLLLPQVMENCSPAFSSELCNYRVERNRESTARVTVWREFGVRRSYTLETSYCGCDQGPYKGYHFDTIHLQEIGANFCAALDCLYDERKWRIDMLLTKQDGNRYIYSSSNYSNNNFMQMKFAVSGIGIHAPQKMLHPVSPIWSTRKSAANTKKITTAQMPTQVNSF